MFFGRQKFKPIHMYLKFDITIMHCNVKFGKYTVFISYISEKEILDVIEIPLLKAYT